MTTEQGKHMEMPEDWLEKEIERVKHKFWSMSLADGYKYVLELESRLDTLSGAAEMLAETLESVWYSEFSNNETCMEGRQIKEALARYKAVKGEVK